jgi:CRP/FNR family transcriptional regulator, cyclic AMP receptor protein
MRKVLYILGELTDGDIEWFIEVGSKKTIAPEEILIREGRTADGLFILLTGVLAVVSPTGIEVARLERGEIVGEMSIVESRPPNVSVKAVSQSQVFLIPRALLQRRLGNNEGFAGRFYKAIALFMSDRLRSTTALASTQNRSAIKATDEFDELDDKVLDNVYLAGTRFEAMLKRLTEGRSS